MSLAEKQTEGLIFDNCVGLAVDNILLDDDTNEAFRKINGNIAGVEWEADPPEAKLHMPKIFNNQYAPLTYND